MIMLVGPLSSLGCLPAWGLYPSTPPLRRSVDVAPCEVEARDAAVTEVDEEPRLKEVLHGRAKRPSAETHFHPAPARVFPQPEVVEEAAPAVLARSRRSAVTRPERDPATDSEAASGAVVRSREADVAHPASVEREEDLAAVEPVVAVDRAAVAVDDVEAMADRAVLALDACSRLVQRDVADLRPRDEKRRVVSSPSARGARGGPSERRDDVRRSDPPQEAAGPCVEHAGRGAVPPLEVQPVPERLSGDEPRDRVPDAQAPVVRRPAARRADDQPAAGEERVAPLAADDVRAPAMRVEYTRRDEQRSPCLAPGQATLDAPDEDRSRPQRPRPPLVARVRVHRPLPGRERHPLQGRRGRVEPPDAVVADAQGPEVDLGDRLARRDDDRATPAGVDRQRGQSRVWAVSPLGRSGPDPRQTQLEHAASRIDDDEPRGW